jgi:hypothetical protein
MDQSVNVLFAAVFGGMQRGTLPTYTRGSLVSLHRALISGASPVSLRMDVVEGARVHYSYYHQEILPGTLILIGCEGVPIPEDAAMHPKAGSGRVMSIVP